MEWTLPTAVTRCNHVNDSPLMLLFRGGFLTRGNLRALNQAGFCLSRAVPFPLSHNTDPSLSQPPELEPPTQFKALCLKAYCVPGLEPRPVMLPPAHKRNLAPFITFLPP